MLPHVLIGQGEVAAWREGHNIVGMVFFDPGAWPGTTLAPLSLGRARPAQVSRTKYLRVLFLPTNP
jgi:hypothetical protein